MTSHDVIIIQLPNGADADLMPMHMHMHMQAGVESKVRKNEERKKAGETKFG